MTSVDAELTDDQARRLIIRAVAALVVFILCAAVAVVLVRQQGDGGGTLDQDTVAANVDGLPGVGPPAGVDLASYSARRGRVLATLSGRAVAVVSFGDYRSRDSAEHALDGVRVRALLVAARHGSPSVVTGPLDRWAAAERAAGESERTNLVQMLKDTTDPEFIAQFKADVARITALLAGLDPAGPVVFGAVVDGSAAALRSLQRPGTRLVDPVGRQVPADLAALHGVRPEETAKAGDPPTRP